VIPKPISDIQRSDIDGLVTNQVHEMKTLDFKRNLPGTADSDKVRFLANVASFANTSGGDLVFGVEESGGIAVNALGVTCSDTDKEVLRLEQLIRTGLEPRLPRIDIRSVSVGPGREVIVVRIPHSLAGPHRVSFNSKFYGRNSAGRYELDVSELRAAFTGFDTLGEKIHRFRVDRVIKIADGETPVSLQAGPTMALHLIPLSAFTTRRFIDISANERVWITFAPLFSSSTGFNYRINFEGWVNFDGHMDFGAGTNAKPSHSYVQLYRSGIVESVVVFPGFDPCVL
jgi:Putative DNA-binding domain